MTVASRSVGTSDFDDDSEVDVLCRAIDGVIRAVSFDSTHPRSEMKKLKMFTVKWVSPSPRG